jgi:DNA-binding transcriptional LysR family regulator
MQHLVWQQNVDNSSFRRYILFRMDTRFLDSFVTVVDTGSIAEAARRLNLTSAAVAQRIRTLESEIGASLVVRSGRTVRPTEAGAAILARARNFLGEVRDLKSIAANDRPSGELRLGAFQTAVSGLLPGILTLMAEQYPQIEVYIARAGSAELYPKVLAGDLDAAIIARPPFAIPKVCDWRALREEPLIVLTPASARVRDPNVILASEPFIRPDRKSWAGQLADGYLRRAGIRPRERFELDSIEAIATMVDRGLGVSLVHDWAPPWPEGLSLRKLPVPDPSFSRHIDLIWTRASPRLRLVKAFLEVAVTALAPGRAAAPERKRGNRAHRR